jgi:hypothetical protein
MGLESPESEAVRCPMKSRCAERGAEALASVARAAPK